MEKYNFSAGPSILPQEVIQKASAAILNFSEIGLSILEISHRRKEYVKVVERAKDLVKELLEIPQGYSILFLQGGASTQFLMVPVNFLNRSAAYLDTGTWASKAIKEAKCYGKVNVVASSKDKNYSYISKNYSIPNGVDYFHITTNNTIYGTQIKEVPNVEVPLIADMSSDIFSKPIDISKYALVYAGAQKNLGPAGATLVIVKDELLSKVDRQIPTMLDYQTHIDKGSMFNTPPVFSIYVSMLNLEYTKKIGGLKEIEKKNNKKAALLYNEIDKNPLFKGTVVKEDRSLMNVCFLLTDTLLKDKFDSMCKEAGISGIKGHRSVGGYRASIYNAMPIESVQVLVDVMSAL